VRPIKRIAFFAFPGLTLLDLVGAYDSLRRVALMGIDSEVTHRVVGTRAEISDESGIRFVPDGVYDDLSAFDLLLLGQAGYLRGKRATTHHNAYELLAPYCREVVRTRRIVDEGNVITAGGVTSALDLGLYLVERFWGKKARERVAQQMEYRDGRGGVAPADRSPISRGKARPRAGSSTRRSR
jgi:cyclohexyl-isocyanide hydratase